MTRRERQVTTENIRSVVTVALLMVIAVVGPTQAAAASTTEPTTEPPATEAPDDTTDSTDTTDTTESAGDVPEPSGASPAIWIGVIVLVAAAIVWAVRQSATAAEPSPDDDGHTAPDS